MFVKVVSTFCIFLWSRILNNPKIYIKFYFRNDLEKKMLNLCIFLQNQNQFYLSARIFFHRLLSTAYSQCCKIDLFHFYKCIVITSLINEIIIMLFVKNIYSVNLSCSTFLSKEYWFIIINPFYP